MYKMHKIYNVHIMLQRSVFYIDHIVPRKYKVVVQRRECMRLDQDR